MSNTTYMTQAEIDALNEQHGERCDGCGEKTAADRMIAYRGYELCPHCKPIWEMQDIENETINP